MITSVEIKRKIVHMATLAIPVGYILLSKETVLNFLVTFFFCYLIVDILRHFHPGVASLFEKYFYGRVLREKEKYKLMGSTYFLFSTILTILLFPKSIAIVSLLILILADTAGALIGRWIGKVPVFGKTLEGSTAFFITALLIVWSYPQLSRFPGSLAALGATLIEVLPIEVDDNLTIPLVAGGIMLLCGG
jgi:dolichol kinase